MVDVARLAGVSAQTVSRVLNDYEFIRPATRDAVLDAIRRLGYRPNRAARTLATDHSRTIGVVATEYRSHGPATILWAIEEAVRDAGYEVSALSLRESDDRTIRGALDRLASQAVEGIVFIAPQSPTAHAAFASYRDVPIVTVMGFASDRGTAVFLDSVAGSQLATQHLIDLGHRRVAHLAGAPAFAVSQSRIEGWRAALSAADLPAPPHVAGDWTVAGGYEAGRRLLHQTPDLTAVHVANDHMALGLLLALHRSGRRVPDDVSVVGFDDIPEAAYSIPPLTTVRQDFGALGRQCVDALLELIAGAPPRQQAPLVPELVIRESTAAPPR
jgi:DNA-binding LacI/PurR family transcriptional regulator